MTQDEARAELRLILKPGQTIYTTLRHVSRSGMMRRISLMALTVGSTDQMGGMHNLDWLIVRAGWGKTRAGKDGLVAGGCGMDMGFALVYDLGRHLWPDGTPQPHGTRNGQPDSDGGYALKHRWL